MNQFISDILTISFLCELEMRASFVDLKAKAINIKRYGCWDIVVLTFSSAQYVIALVRLMISVENDASWKVKERYLRDKICYENALILHNIIYIYVHMERVSNVPPA